MCVLHLAVIFTSAPDYHLYGKTSLSPRTFVHCSLRLPAVHNPFFLIMCFCTWHGYCAILACTGGHVTSRTYILSLPQSSVLICLPDTLPACSWHAQTEESLPI